MAVNIESFFSFEKKGILFKKPSRMKTPGPYYTCLVPMQNIKNFPFEYALYFSTDHHIGKGGIYLYLCNGIPSESKNWKSYNQAISDGDFDYLNEKPKKNPIFIDKKHGKHHTETPHANVIDGKVYMSYHKGLWGKQATLMALSDDGVNFEKINNDNDAIILDPNKHGGHTGYFRWAVNKFHRIDYTYIGYSLHGGGNDYHSAMWGSNDAIKWEKIQIFTPIEGYAMEEKDMIMIWHEIDPQSITKIGDDEYIAISAGGNRASGGDARIVELYEIFLAGDGKTLTRKSRKILPQGEQGSSDCEEVSSPTVIQIGDQWHLIYVGACNKGRKNSVMSAVGEFNTNAPLTQKIPSEELQSNFYSE